MSAWQSVAAAAAAAACAYLVHVRVLSKLKAEHAARLTALVKRLEAPASGSSGGSANTRTCAATPHNLYLSSHCSSLPLASSLTPRSS